MRVLLTTIAILSGLMSALAYAGPNAGASIAVDLDVGTSGIQPNATVPIGENLEVDVIVCGVSDLRATTFDLLYDFEALEIVSITEGDFLGSGGETTIFLDDTTVAGAINIAISILGASASCVNDTGVVARITFKIDGSQESQLQFNDVLLRDCPNENEDDITSNAVGGVIEPSVPEITITSLAGGENWTGGSSHDICWSIVKGTASYTIKLWYSANGGDYTSIATGLNQADTGAGSYSWDPIPPIDSTNVVIKAEVTDGNDGTDTNVSSSFTIDSTSPTVSTATPAPGATDQVLNASIQVNFSEAVDSGSAEAAFSINPNPGGLSFNWNNAWTVMTINHETFAPGTTYNVTIDTTLKDLSDPGNNMASDTTWSFTTADILEIVLNSPNGSENWTGNTAHDIVYTISGGAASYTAQFWYSIDSGDNYYTSIGSTSANAGVNTYTWTTPSGLTDNEVRVRVVVTDGSAQMAEDESDTDFTADSTAPQVISVSPANGATNVLIWTDIDISFSETMNQTATQGAFSISSDPGGLNYSWNGNALTITHNNFTYATTYNCTVSTATKDISDPGNSLASDYAWSFTTVNQLAVGLTSPNGSEDWTGGDIHSVNYTITSGIGPYTAELYYSTDGGTNWIGPSDTHAAGSGANIYAWLTPSVDSDQVRVKVVVSDSSAQEAADSSDANFTIDSTPPSVISTLPDSNEINVPITADIIINFSESMDPASIAAVSITPAVANLSFAWDVDTNTLTITHDPLTYSTTYHCTVFTRARDDSNTGNPLAVAYSWSFTTAGVLDVQLTSPDGGENWTGDSSHDITWAINGGIPPYQVEIQLSTDSGTTYSDTFTRLAQNSSGSGSYNWTVDLIDSTTLRMRVLVTDSGNQSDSDASEADFTIDSTKPTVTTTSPANEATDVLIGTDIVVVFSEAMKEALTQGAFSLSPDPDGMVYSWNGDTLTITHNDFTYGTTYTCTVSTAAKDVSGPGNPLASDYTWSFTTMEQFTVELTAPNGGEDWTGGSSKNITWNISEGLAPYTVKLYYSTDGGINYTTITTITDTNAVSGSYSWILPTITSSQIRVRVEVSDSGTPIRTADDVSADLTIDSTPPEVSSANPSNGATNVAVGANLQVTFNEEMNRSAAQSAFSISPNPGGLSYPWNVNTLTTTHNPFTYATTYSCTISAAAKDDSDPGNNPAAAYSWSFTTMAMSVTLNSPTSGELWDGENPHNISWTIGGGVAPYTIELYYSTNGGASYDTTITTISDTTAVSGSCPWTPSGINSGQVRVKVEVTDANTNTASDISKANFTIDSTRPTVTEKTPDSGAIGAALDQAVVITFSEEMQTASFSLTCSPDPGGWNYSWSDGNTKVAYSHNPFTLSTDYTLQINGKDKAGNSLATVSWSFKADRPPVLTAIGDKSVNEGDTLTFAITASDADSGDTLTYTAGNLPSGANFSGTAFTWKLGYDQAGTYDVTFQVTDDKGISDSETITITVADVNRCPALAEIGNKTVDEGQTLTFSVSASDSDTEDTISYTAQPLPGGASFGNPAFTWGPGYDQAGTYPVTFIATDSQGDSDSETIIITVNNVNRPPVLEPIDDITVNEGETITITPTASDPDGDSLSFTYSGWMNSPAYTTTYDDAGTHTVIITVSDGELSDSQEVTIIVNNVNHFPVLASIGDKSVNKGDTLTFEVTASDSDTEDTISYTAQPLPGGASFGNFTFTWVPDYDQAGTYPVTFIATDSQGDSDSETIIITVNNINRPPVLDHIADITVNEGQPATITPTASDPDGDSLTFSCSGWMTTATYTTDYDDSGTYTVIVTVSDGELSDSQAVIVTVNDVNRLPVLESIGDKQVNENELLEFTITATDPDGDSLAYLAVSLPDGATFTNPAFNWTPTYEQAGVYSVTFSVDDGRGGIDTETITITVNNTNCCPVLSEIGDVSIQEGDTLTLSIVASDSDQDTISCSVTGLPQGAVLEDCILTWIADYTDSGNYLVTIKVSDGVCTDQESIIITVGDINRPPELDAIARIKVNEAERVAIAPTASDPDGDSLTFSYSGWMSSATYTTTYDDAGTHTVIVTVSDGELSDSCEVTITVIDVLSTNAIFGQVRDTDNQAIEGVKVEVLKGGAVWKSISTDANGEYSITGLSGTYNIRASKEGYVTQGKENMTLGTEVNFILIPSGLKTYAYPNPFDMTRTDYCTIKYHLPEAEHVSIRIYDITGRLIRELVNKKHAPGTYRHRWDGEDEDRNPVASGAYLYIIKAGSKTRAKKIAVIR